MLSFLDNLEFLIIYIMRFIMSHGWGCPPAFGSPSRFARSDRRAVATRHDIVTPRIATSCIEVAA